MKKIISLIISVMMLLVLCSAFAAAPASAAWDGNSTAV